MQPGPNQHNHLLSPCPRVRGACDGEVETNTRPSYAQSLYGRAKWGPLPSIRQPVHGLLDAVSAWKRRRGRLVCGVAQSQHGPLLCVLASPLPHYR